MKNPFLFGLMAILLLGGTITPALSQSTSDSVVINEVEINPLNGAEFVELYNPTSQPVDVSGWSLTPSLTWKNYVIISNTIIEPQSFAAFTHHSSWFKDFGDTISLTNSSGDLIDQTPLLADQNNDANTWQRNTDGLDTNSISDWKLKIMTPKSSNGIIIETQETFYSFTAQTEKTKYTFGEILKIYGSTTETLFKDTREAIPAVINIKIQGPNYYKTLTAYPDRDLNFSTTLNIKEVLGFTVGDYDVDISYGDNFTHTEFSVTEELNSSFTETESENLEIFTNKKSYLPGEIVTLSASTDSLIEYAGLDYLVLDPNGKQIAQGTIFPNSQFSIVHKSGGGQIYPFSTQFLMQSVQPVYGTYEILGTYAAQDPIYRSAGVEINTSANFELIEDVKEDIEISLSTDKEIYEVDEIVKITGRSNNIWTEDLELHIIQTGIFESDTRYQAFSPLNEKYSIKLNGDGTFEYDFQIPANTESGLAYGDYLIKVSEYFGQNTKIIKVVENSESFVDVRTNLGLKMDKSKYVLGTAMTISGSVLNYEQNENPQKFRGNEIKFTFTDSDGKHLMSEDRIQAFDEQYAKTPNDKLTFTAIPDAVGGYQINAILHPLQFDIGKYTVTANHYTSKSTESIDFEVVTAQSELLPSTETQEPLIFELCSSTRNDISEIMKDLKQIGKGEIPPSMESIDCDGNTDFVTGEKLVIRGQVALKQTTFLDDSSANPSGQTHGGSSYTTNYAQSELNYIELSIPYPQTLIVSTSYQTTPSEGEEYHGGGGASGGGVMSKDGGIGSGIYGTRDGGGNESERHTGYNADVVLREVTKNLMNMSVKAYPDDNGTFNAVFDLRAGIFIDGIYKLKANYFGHKYEDNFFVSDNSLKGGLKPQVLLDSDKDVYIPGEIVLLSGKIMNVYYYDSVSLIIEPPDISKTNCLIGQQCGFGNSEKKIRVNEGVEGATFFMNYKIPPTAELGTYTATADTHFGKVEKQFIIIDESELIGNVPPSDSSSIIPKKIIEKFNRITGNDIPIILAEKSFEESTLVPRVIQGSLFTSARGDESNVNIKVTTPGGECIIGQDSRCLISESTRKPGEIYSTVSIDNINYKIRYSGNDVRLEKFSIVPEDSNSKIDIDTWNVEIMKDNQPSRFYYKVSYVALE